jgi:hypothetical protein
VNCSPGCFEIVLASCPEEIILKNQALVSKSVKVFIKTPSGKVYINEVTADEEGKISIPTTDFPAGSFNPFSGYYKLWVEEDGTRLQLTFGEDTYDCVLIDFEEIQAAELINSIQ